MKLYLDNCCFNRPYDDQSQIPIKLESEAKLAVQGAILRKELELVWSYILDFENSKNPFPEKRNRIETWKTLAQQDVVETDEILSQANEFIVHGLKAMDALHLSCAVSAGCDIFLTTDKGILNKRKLIEGIEILNPVEFLVISPSEN